MPKTLKKLLITLIILIAVWLLRLDTVLIGENFVWTAFFILLGLGIMFHSAEEQEEKIRIIRYELHNMIFGSDKEKEEACAYAVEQHLLLEDAKKEMEKKYGSHKDEMQVHFFRKNPKPKDNDSTKL